MFEDGIFSMIAIMLIGLSLSMLLLVLFAAPIIIAIRYDTCWPFILYLLYLIIGLNLQAFVARGR